MKTERRIFDLTLAISGGIVLLQLFPIVAMLIKFNDGGPAFFRQERVGFKGRPFYIWKFRSMTTKPKEQGLLLTVGRDPRLTAVGYWIRKTKVDELPQLFNVLRGEMSLVGPRPEVPRYVALYTPEQQRVLDLVPGITDPASIQYRKESEFLAGSNDPERTYVDVIMPEKIRLNLLYAERANIATDFRIILKTFLQLAR